jgi:hypothetical protein
MNLGGTESVEGSHLNVVSFINRRTFDFLQETQDFDHDSETYFTALESHRQEVKSPLVKEHQFPEQSIYTLQEQLMILKSKLGRIKFYLEELEDILPQ